MSCIWCLEGDFDVSVNEFIAQTLTQKERVDLGLVGLVSAGKILLTGGLHQESRVIMEEKKEMSTEEIKMDNDPKGEGKEKASSPLREVLSWVVTLLAAFALAMVLKNYVIINATVPTGSMEHTIEPGDDLFGLRLAYQFQNRREEIS